MSNRRESKNSIIQMQDVVIKRDGREEQVNLNKITNSLRKLKEDVEEFRRKNHITPHELNINVVSIAKQTIPKIYDRITTSELDVFSAEVCSSLNDHSDYHLFGGNILIRNLEANNKDSLSFARYAEKAYNHVSEFTNEHSPLISLELYNIAQKYGHLIDKRIVMERNFRFDYFGMTTLMKGQYLLSEFKTKKENGVEIKDMVPFETPQHMFMRVAIGINGWNLESAFQLYDVMSMGFAIHATPTLFHSGTPKQQNSSCYLQALKQDSILGIYDTLQDCAQISKHAGGIGIHVHNVRSENSYIRGTNGKSNGIIPMLQVFNATARYVDQGGGKRKGSFAIYLEPWHADIFQFLTIRLVGGADSERARDLFSALWVPNLFMKRTLQEYGNDDSKDGDPVMWSLMDPNVCPGLSDVWGEEFENLYLKYESEKKYTQQVPIRTLWEAILTSQIETGTPYILFKDYCNEFSNQKNLGTIKSSNLCVAGDTQILTLEHGYVPIKDLCNQQVNVWNGVEWSNVTPRMTNISSPLLKISFSNGTELNCTKYHKFFIIDPDDMNSTNGVHDANIIEIEAKDLSNGDILVPFSLPSGASICSRFKSSYFDLCINPYDLGVFYMIGSFRDNDLVIPMNNRTLQIKKYLQINMKNYNYTNSDNEHIYLHDSYYDEAYSCCNVPMDSSFSIKLVWLKGLIDASGKLLFQDDSNPTYRDVFLEIEFTNENVDKLDVFLLLQTIGVESEITDKTIRIDRKNTYYLHTLGCDPYLLDLSKAKNQLSCFHFDSKTKRTVTVTKVEDEGVSGPTYCFNETKRHAGMFNGVLTGNCSEIIEYSSADETAVCNLASISLPSFVNRKTLDFDYAKLYEITRIMIRNLNKIIDRNYYPTKESERSNKRHRPLGLGVQGLADTFCLMKIRFGSDESRKVNRRIFETMYFAALTESNALTREIDPNTGQMVGPYPSMYENGGAPISHGIFHHEMMGIGIDKELEWDWESLREKVKKEGIRNSLLIALMPTASTSQILGNTECFEPFTSMMYVRKTKHGEFFVYCKYLIDELHKRGLWKSEINPITKESYIPMKELIKKHNGRIQDIQEIPQDIKDVFVTVQDISLKDLTKLAHERSAFIDQAQSLNVYFKNDDNMMSKMLKYFAMAWRLKMKNGCYYVRTIGSRSAIDFSAELINENNKRNRPQNNENENKRRKDKDEKNIVCNDEVCLSCQG
jgi:ribonucleoside-diphosphate reductase alpha chain